MSKTTSITKLIMPAVVSVVCLSSCGKSNPAIYGEASEPVRVETILAGGSPSVSSASDPYSGTIQAGESSVLSFSVPGKITKIYVSEGQSVRKGQLVASVGAETLDNSYKMAAASLAEAQDAYARLKKLHDANALPEIKWVEVQQKLKQAEASAAIAKKAMKDANLYSPISGIVSKKYNDAGQNVVPGAPVVEVVDISGIKVKITVSEKELSSVPAGAEAKVSVGENNPVVFTARQTERGVTANPLSRNYDLVFSAPNPDGTLRPGMICDVWVERNTSSDASVSQIVLPPQAVVLDWDNSHAVWIKKNGEAKRVKVEIGGVDSRGVVVTSGLQPSDSVVVKGQQKLSQGLSVISIN
jgi:RND family efflux transporter MFP subunit